VAQVGRRAGLRSRLLEVQVLSPTSDFRRRSSIGSSASMPRSRLGVRVSSPTPDFMHAWPSGFRGAGPQPLSGRFDSVSVLQVWQAEMAEVAQVADARSLNLRPLRVRFPPSASKGFCGGASAQLGLISLDLLGALPRPAITSGALGKFGQAVSFSS
jgi:hypothetical protein